MQGKSVIRVRYEGGVLKPLEHVELREGEELIVKIERVEDRKRLLEKLYGVLGPTPKELIDEVLEEAEAG